MISAEELRRRLLADSVNKEATEILEGINKTLLKYKPGDKPVFRHTFDNLDEAVRNEIARRLNNRGYTVSFGNCLKESLVELIIRW